MAFLTLEDRFKQVSQQIYNRFAPDSDQLTVVKPNSGKGVFRSSYDPNIKYDSRLVPTVSQLRDIERIKKFLLSGPGQLFVAKQLLLQTGNTFSETRFYNPLGALINTAIPTRGTTRHIGNGLPISFFGLTNNVTRDNRGRLQKSTLERFGVQISSADYKKLLPNGFWARPEDRIFELTINTPGAKFVNSKLYNVQPVQNRGEPVNKELKTVLFASSSNSNYDKFISSVVPNTALTFKSLESVSGSNGYFSGSYYGLGGPFLGTAETPSVSTTSRIVDRINTDLIVGSNQGTGTFYQTIFTTTTSDQSRNDDIIKFIFQTNEVGANPVHFRAFLSSFKESVKPEFSEQRYIGRTERYVTYGGAKRTATMEFDIVAFSAGELENVWKRVNYLTGLAFPLGVSQSGFIIPPLFKITIGAIYDSQPCYIETLDFDFIDDNSTFDIDSEVPQRVHVNMSIVLLEKSSKRYDTPFYSLLGG